MSQPPIHPNFPAAHLPRGVAASALTLQKNASGATTMLRAAGGSPAIQIPAAPSVPSVSVSVPGHPVLGRTPVISAIRPSTPPSTRSPSPAVSISDHPRANLIVQGAGGPGAITGPPLQITLTQRQTPLGMSEALKMPLAGKTVMTQPGLLQHGKVSTGPPGQALNIGMAAHLQPQAVLASKSGLQLSSAVPSINISSLSGPLQAATVVAPASTTIPIAKVPPQRQQLPMTTGLPTLQTMTSGSEFSSMPTDLSLAAQSGAAQLLLRGQGQTVVAATTVTSTLGATIPTPLSVQHGERPMLQPVLNLTTHSAAQNLTDFTRFFYQNPRHQIVSTSAYPPQIIRPGTNTFYVPQAGGDQSKITAQTPNLAASLSHPLNPAQPAVLLNAHMMVDGLRHGLNAQAAVSMAGGLQTQASNLATGYDKPVITLSTSGTQQGIHASLIAATTSVTSQSSDLSAFPSSTSLHMAASMASGSSAPPSNLSLTSRATVASSIIAAASGIHQNLTSSQQAPGTPGGSREASANASPRPSILRKRNVDGNVVVPRKPNFTLMSESHSPRPEMIPVSNISSPKTPATDNSQSSTDTALSSNDAPTTPHNHEVKIKHELIDGTENGPTASPAVSQAGSLVDASPRKRARKQLFDVPHRHMSEDVKDNVSSSDEDLEPPQSPVIPHIKQELFIDDREEYIDDEGVRWTRDKTKPTMSLMEHYQMSWKPKFNHFVRYTDVRQKDDRNPTVNELISQKGILQKATGWKIHYVTSQVEDVIENEEALAERMEKVKERLHAKASTSSQSAHGHDYNKLLELARGNLQRCQVVRQQMTEAKNSMLGVLNHRPKVEEIIKKNLAKRTIKKKERT